MIATVPLAAPSAKAAAGALLPVYRRYPVEFVRGEGVELFDAAGRAYLDFTSGIAVNALGYGDAGVLAAMREALATGLIHVSNLYHSAPAERVARALVDRSFASSVFFCNSGAEANEAAFKFARRWARERRAGAPDAASSTSASGAAPPAEIIALRGSFHGRLFASLAATDRPAYRMPFRPLAGAVSIVERDLDTLRAVLDSDTVAAVIVEPVQGEGGVRVLDPGFLRGLRELTAERGAALIFDEVQCGLGRTGALFAYERVGVEPDALTLAKPLAGGLPMGAVLLSAPLAAAVQPGDHATTFGGGPLVASVALHVLERVADPQFLAAIRRNGEWLGGELRALAARSGRVRDVRGVGYMWGLDVQESASLVVGRALEAGLLVCTAGDHTVRLLPPLVATREHLARGLSILGEALS